MYDRHAIIIDNTSRSCQWPSRFERSTHFASRYAVATQRLKKNKPASGLLKLKITAASARETRCLPRVLPWKGFNPQSREFEKHSIMVFPENIVIHDVEFEAIPDLVKLLSTEKTVHTGSFDSLAGEIRSEELNGVHILVCAHSLRDLRCASCGPASLQNFNVHIKEDEAKDSQPTFVWASSHIGGHHLAGCAIVYPVGDWFGRVISVEDAGVIYENYRRGADASQPVPTNLLSLWRGRMGMTREDTLALHAAEMAEFGKKSDAGIA